MSYELTDGRQSKGQFASNGGYSDLIRYVQAHASAYPGMLALLEAGESSQVAKIRREVLQPTQKAPLGVASTMTVLGQLLQGMKQVVISDGVASGDIAAYSPDEARDKNGEWTSGSTFYHGTSKDSATYIRQNGFGTSRRVGGISEGAPAGERNLTYITPSKSAAKWFADNSTAAGPYGGTPKHGGAAVLPVQFAGKIYAPAGATSIYDAARELGLKPDARGEYDLDALKSALNKAGYHGVAYKDPNANGRKAVAVFNPETLSIKAYSEDEPRDDHGKWTTGGDSATTIHYAKNLRFPKITTDAAWRAELQNNMTAAVAKYAASPNYDEAGITKWMTAYDQLRAAGAPEDTATLMKAAEGNGVYPEVAASMGMVPLQVQYNYDDIVRWTADDFTEFADSAQKVIDGATDANPAMVLEYAHTQAALQQRLTKRNQPTDAVNLYRGLRTEGKGFDEQVSALKALANAPDWSISWKTSGAESWTPDKDKAYQYKGETGIIIGTKIPVTSVITAEPVNPQAFSAQPTEQEYIVAHPRQLVHMSKQKFELVAATDMSRVLQAVETLRASGWKVTVEGKNIVLEEPHPEINWLHDRRKKMLNAKAHKLEAKTVFQGLQISIENKVGSTRSGVKPDGTPWSVVMPFDYGYIRGTVGQDGQHVDCFIGPDKAALFAYVIHQTKQASDEYDEDKVMLGFPSPNAAKKAYASAFDDKVGLMQSMTTLPMRIFIEKVLKTKERKRSKKIHAGGGDMNLEAQIELQAGGPGSGRHPEGGLSEESREKLEEWLKSQGYQMSPNQAGLRHEHLWTRKSALGQPGGLMDNIADGQIRHSVTVAPDGSWSHTVDGDHAGQGLHRLTRVAATNSPTKTRAGLRIVKPGSVVRTVPRVTGSGKGLAMLKLHMRRIQQVKE